MTKVAFFADTETGKCVGFCKWRSDGNYSSMGFYEPTEHIIDIEYCTSFNDAKRHSNYLKGYPLEEGVDPALERRKL